MSFKRRDSKLVYEGTLVDVRIDGFDYEDGATAEREIVAHPGAVAIVAHDADSIYLVRQPREAVGEQELLELPAGKLDVEGESPLDCGRRELREEVGLSAREWRELKTIYSSPGFTSERVHLFLATGLELGEADPGPGERIEVVAWPLAELDGAIAACADAKSLVGLLILRALRRED